MTSSTEECEWPKTSGKGAICLEAPMETAAPRERGGRETTLMDMVTAKINILSPTPRAVLGVLEDFAIDLAVRHPLGSMN